MNAGDAILTALHGQRNKVLSARVNNESMQSDMDVSERRMSRMACERCVQRYICLICLLLVIGGASFYLYWRYELRDDGAAPAPAATAAALGAGAAAWLGCEVIPIVDPTKWGEVPSPPAPAAATTTTTTEAATTPAPRPASSAATVAKFLEVNAGVQNAAALPTLTVTYANHDVVPGEHFQSSRDAFVLNPPPAVSWSAIRPPLDPTKHRAVIMFDPDAPEPAPGDGATPGANAPYLHAVWTTHGGNAATAPLAVPRLAVPYEPPAPPKGTHRYVFVLFEQAGEKPIVVSEGAETRRREWDLKAFLAKNPGARAAAVNHLTCSPPSKDRRTGVEDDVHVAEGHEPLTIDPLYVV